MSKKILITEDDPFLVKISSNRLKEEGFEVDQANDGEEALALMEKNKYAMVLLDLIMPKKDGFAVLKELAERKDKTPVFVFSNLSQEEDKEEVLKLGAKGFYIKSDVAIDELVEIVKNTVK